MPKCGDCGGPLIVSPDQTECVYKALDPDHGDQLWWDCIDPECRATWEDEEGIWQLA